PGDDIPIHLRKAGRRYEFQTPATQTQSRGAAGRRVFSVRAGSVSDGRRRPSLTLPARTEATLSQPFGLIMLLLTEPVANQQPPAQPKKDDEPTTLDATIRLRDIEVSELLD